MKQALTEVMNDKENFQKSFEKEFLRKEGSQLCYDYDCCVDNLMETLFLDALNL